MKIEPNELLRRYANVVKDVPSACMSMDATILNRRSLFLSCKRKTFLPVTGLCLSLSYGVIVVAI